MSARKARRPDLRGPGFMTKGGRPATVAHNARQRAAAVAAPPPTVERRVVPSAGRVSDRAEVRTGERLAVVCVAAAGAAAGLASLLELVVW